MANKKLTEEQQSQIKTLLANNEMLEKTKKEAMEKGTKGSVSQIERAQQEVIDHINSIDPTALENAKKEKKRANSIDLFGDTDMSIFNVLEEENESRPTKHIEDADLSSISVNDAESPADNDVYAGTETVIAEATTFNDIDPTVQYDVIQLPSNGQCYKNKMDRIPVAYLTAYDENIITSPNLYKDGLVIDFLLKNKIVNKEINPDDLVSGDIDAITLFLRATSYGPDFPIVVADPETGEQIETTVDLTTLKPKEFKLIGDENGYFDYTLPVTKAKVKFRYLTRKMEKQLRKLTELENYGTNALDLDYQRQTIIALLENDDILTTTERNTIRESLKIMESWSNKMREKNNSTFTKVMTNTMLLHIVSINGNSDRGFIKKFVNGMPARDALMLRRYISDNKPGIDFNIEVKRPESLGGGSFKTFLNWDDSVFLNIADI
jgi:hypothetical protein